MEKPFCASSPEAVKLTDAEFWAKVYPQPSEDEVAEAYYDEIQRETWVLHCARCQRYVEVDETIRHLREHDAFCDDCAGEMEPDVEDTWDENKSIFDRPWSLTNRSWDGRLSRIR